MTFQQIFHKPIFQQQINSQQKIIGINFCSNKFSVFFQRFLKPHTHKIRKVNIIERDLYDFFFRFYLLKFYVDNEFSEQRHTHQKKDNKLFDQNENCFMEYDPCYFGFPYIYLFIMFLQSNQLHMGIHKMVHFEGLI